MRIYNVTRDILYAALQDINARLYDGNITFRDAPERVAWSKYRPGFGTYHLTLGITNTAQRTAARGKHADGTMHSTRVCGVIWSRCRKRISGKGCGRSHGAVTGDGGKGQREYVAACWHAHGEFFDAVARIALQDPKYREIIYGTESLQDIPGEWLRDKPGVRKGEIIVDAQGKRYSIHDDWRNNRERDFQRGSQMYPYRASEACDCGN